MEMDSDELTMAEKQRLLELNQKHVSGSSWFGTIALLSAINIVIDIFQLNVTFPVGLGLSGVGSYYFRSKVPDQHNIGVFLLAGAALIIVLMYVCKNKTAEKHLGFYWIGAVTYFADALLTLLYRDWVALAFHAWGLYAIITGWYACKQLLEFLAAKYVKDSFISKS